MKHRRKRVSRSTLQKCGAELEQRLREQAAQERRERLNQFRDWLRFKFPLDSIFFSSVLILLPLGIVFLIIKLWLILLPVYAARLGIPIPAAVALLVATGVSFSGVSICSNVPLYMVLRQENQIRYELFPIWLLRRNQLNYQSGFNLHTFVAINVIGGLLPLMLALYQFNRTPPLGILIVTAITTTVCYFSVRVVPSTRIEFKAGSLLIVSIITALSAMSLVAGGIYRTDVSAAFAGGVLGSLIGADLLHLRELQVENSVVPLSIGGGGQDDGILLCGFYSLLIAEWMPNLVTFLKL